MKNDFSKIMNENLNKINEDYAMPSSLDYYNNMYGYSRKESGKDKRTREQEELNLLKAKLEYERKVMEKNLEELKKKNEIDKYTRDFEWAKEKEKHNWEWEKEKRNNLSAREINDFSWKYYDHDTPSAKDLLNFAKSSGIDKKEENIKIVISKYIENFIKLKEEFGEFLENTINSSKYTANELNFYSQSGNGAIPADAAQLLKKIQSKKAFFDQRVKNLSSKLVGDARKKIRDNKVSLFTSITDEVTDDLISLTENFFEKKFNLSILEENLIFGDTLTNIEDITLLEATDPLSGENLDHSAAKQINNAERTTGAAENRVIAAQKTGNQNEINQAKMSATRAKLSQIKVNNLVKEEANPTIAAKEVVLDKKQTALNNRKERSQETFEKQQEAINKQKEQLSAAKEKVSSINSTKENVNNETVTTLTEKMDDTYGKKNRIDFNNFSKTLFDGSSGNALRYAIKGEINNVNSVDIEVVKFMQTKPEYETVIKKLKFYLRKTASGLSYEEYIDMKVLKGKFRTLFGQAKKEYANRFK